MVIRTKQDISALFEEALANAKNPAVIIIADYEEFGRDGVLDIVRLKATGAKAIILIDAQNCSISFKDQIAKAVKESSLW